LHKALKIKEYELQSSRNRRNAPARPSIESLYACSLHISLSLGQIGEKAAVERRKPTRMPAREYGAISWLAESEKKRITSCIPLVRHENILETRKCISALMTDEQKKR
jgi:hypothetical protein